MPQCLKLLCTLLTVCFWISAFPGCDSSPDSQDSPPLSEEIQQKASDQKLPQHEQASFQNEQNATCTSIRNHNSVSATVINNATPATTPPPGEYDEGETRSRSRFPENPESYKAEPFPHPSQENHKSSSPDPEAPVTNKD